MKRAPKKRRRLARRALACILVDCSSRGWDGDDAWPVTESAWMEADALIRDWPADVRLPELAPEPDGAISLDWIEGGRVTLSVSVSGMGRASCVCTIPVSDIPALARAVMESLA